MIYKGGCHCGAVAFEVEGEIEAALRCNCSICSRKAALLWAVPHESLKVEGAPAMGRYTFNRHVLAHRFCRTCGIHPFAEDVSEGAGRNAYINLRCIENLDVLALPVVEFDGRSV